MSDLKPCPFCGGEASTYSMETWWVSHACDCLGKYVGTKEYATEAEAIEAWNTRAELGSGTCKPKWTLQGETQTQEFWSCECGNCGEYFGTEDRSSFPFKITINKVDIPNYCPNCGAKVVDE